MLDAKVVSFTLKKIHENASVDVVHSVTEAIAHVEQQDCSFILLDYQLPDGSGLDFLRYFRAESSFADVPVLLMTSHIEPSIIENAFEAGISDYLCKDELGADALSEKMKKLKVEI